MFKVLFFFHRAIPAVTRYSAAAAVIQMAILVAIMSEAGTGGNKMSHDDGFSQLCFKDEKQEQK
jgi:hypothetical protein